jgi:uncharacterized protein (TIGR02598 family)
MKKRRGFSLIEVVLALGVVSFAFVGIVGMVPVGLKNFRQAIDANVQSQISQKISGEMQLSRYSDLMASGFGAQNFPRYFDDQGSPVQSATDPACVYTVTLDPTSPAHPFLPGSTAANTNLLTLKCAISTKSDSPRKGHFTVVVANSGF